MHVHLSTADCSVLLDLTDGALPAIVHWGAPLGDLAVDTATALVLANVPLIGINTVDQPIRLAILPEHHTGYVGRPGLSGSRAGAAWSPRFTVTSAAVDGVAVEDLHQGGPGRLVVTAEDAESALSLTLDLELLPSGLLRARATLANNATGADAAYGLEDLVLAFPVPAQATEILDFAGRWGKERVPQRRPFSVGAQTREGRKGRTGADAATVLHAGTSGFGFEHGEIWAVHTAWSGNHTHTAELTFDGFRTIGGGELLLPGEVVLGSGESYQSPWVYGSYAVGLDGIARRFHAFLRARDRRVSVDRPVTINVWEAVYFDHDLPPLLDLAERAAALGVERYVLDDGWFGSRRDDHSGLGDWVVSAAAWPDGLHPLVDRVHELGMEFGLWFEPEMVNPDSDVARAHPEWVMSARSTWPVESRYQQVLNLGMPECYAHVRDQMMAILAEYDIEYIKWDHNRDLVEAGTQTRGGIPGVHAQTLGVYALMDELRAAHPRLEIESCSSGGSRVDLGVLERTDRVWVSDVSDPLERQSMLRWTAQLLPPEYLGSHIAASPSHVTGRQHDIDFRGATAVFGHFGIEWDLTRATPEEATSLSRWVAFYREYRGLLLDGDLVRLDDPGDGVMAHGVVARDRSRAIYSYALVAYPLQDPTPRLRLRGLDPDRSYRVRPVVVGREPTGMRAPRWFGERTPTGYDGTVLTGAALAGAGVQPPGMAPDQALLFVVEPA